MRYENALIRLLRRTLLWAPALIGWWTEEQHLSLILFEDFVEHSQHRATAVRVTLSHAVRVYEARLHFHAQLSGVRYLLYHWFLSSMLFFVGASVFWQLVAVAAAAYALRDSFGLDHGGDDRAAADEFRGAQELFGARAALPFSQVQPQQHQQQRQNLAMNPFMGGQPLVPAQGQAPAPSRSQQLALAAPPRGSAGNESVGAHGVDLTVAAVAAAAAVPSVMEPAAVGAAAAIISATSPSVSLAAISPLPSSSARSVAGDDTAASFAMPASATLPGLASSAAALPIPSNARLSLSKISVSESDDSQADSNSDTDSDLDSYSHSDDDANVDEDGMIGAPTGRVRGSKRASFLEAARARTMPAAGSVSVAEDSDSQLRQRSRSSQ
jgi:hypothetical protein